MLGRFRIRTIYRENFFVHSIDRTKKSCFGLKSRSVNQWKQINTSSLVFF